MIRHFPSNALHLIYLGVRDFFLLKIWIKGDLPHAKFTAHDQKLILERLTKMRPFTSSQFQRKPRTLDDLSHWKGTEFRFFCYYAAPLVSKGILPREIYTHFMRLDIAVIIFSSYLVHKKLEAVHHFLRRFVEDFVEFYGEELVSYNVHHLLHLADDCENFGCLNLFKAFSFESAMKPIVSSVRHGNKHL